MEIKNVIEVLKAEVIKFDKKKRIKKIKIDSREVEKGDLFFAIIGKNLDGHNYIEEAISNGASVVVVSKLEKEWKQKNVTILLVDDTTDAMIRLASYIRKQYPVPLIAITGSVGKTTTKELIYHILSRKFCVLKSPKNYNNRIGIPLTLFELNNDIQLVVLELGMNHLGEIHELSMLCKPDVGLITNIGTAHIGFLNGQKNILKAKLEILDGMQTGCFIVNPFDKKLRHVKHKSVTMINPIEDYKLFFTNIKLFSTKTYGVLNYQGKKYPITIPIPGSKILENILLAIQVGLLFQIPIDDIVDSITEFKVPNCRGNFIDCDNEITLIDDTYNASIESLENDLTILKLVSGEKYLIFGDFLELGKYSSQIHKKAAKLIRKIPNLNVLLVGKASRKMRKKIPGSIWFSDAEAALVYIKNKNYHDCTMLFKGSRRMYLNKIVSYFTKKD